MSQDDEWLKQSERFLSQHKKLLADVTLLQKKNSAALDTNAGFLEEGEGQLAEVAPLKQELSSRVAELEAAVRAAIAAAPPLNRVDEEELDDEDELEEEEEVVVGNKTKEKKSSTK